MFDPLQTEDLQAASARGGKAKATGDWRPILPVPAEAPQPRLSLIEAYAPDGYTFKHLWGYRDANGQRLGAIARYDGLKGRDADKQFRPFTYCEGPDGSCEWRCQGFPDPRPLYGLDRLAARPDAPVIVVEGEKCADAAGARFPDHVAVCSPNGSGAAHKADWSPLADRNVVVWPDADEPGEKFRAVVVEHLRQVGVATVRVVQPPAAAPAGWDLADDPADAGLDERDVAALLADAEPVEASTATNVLRLVRPADVSTTWKDDLVANADGDPRPILANALHALRNAPELQGTIGFDAFALRTAMLRPAPWIKAAGDFNRREWTETDDALLTEWLQRNEITVPEGIVQRAAETIAQEHAFHPVRDYLDGLKWDGTPRLDSCLRTYFGAEDTDYIRAVGPRWMISAVARIYDPGCQADYALILEGDQGLRKSSSLRTLAGDSWFTDRISDVNSKEAAQELSGVWLVEFSEMQALSKADVRATKAFISRTTDKYRPPYGRRVIAAPRQCVFAGTVNPEGGYLQDPTGARRFWPVKCGQTDREGLKRDRDQLWAEAVHRYRAGEAWYLETAALEALAQAAQADRYVGDPWDEAIAEFVHGKNEISISDVLTHLLVETGRQTQTEQKRVVNSLTAAGFERKQLTRAGKRVWRYVRKPTPSEPAPPQGEGSEAIAGGAVGRSPTAADVHPLDPATIDSAKGAAELHGDNWAVDLLRKYGVSGADYASAISGEPVLPMVRAAVGEMASEARRLGV
jgi:predicted P-loop ATPase